MNNYKLIQENMKSNRLPDNDSFIKKLKQEEQKKILIN